MPRTPFSSSGRMNVKYVHYRSIVNGLDLIIRLFLLFAFPFAYLSTFNQCRDLRPTQSISIYTMEGWTTVKKTQRDAAQCGTDQSNVLLRDSPMSVCQFDSYINFGERGTRAVWG